jgi:hypothetical protein
MDGDYSPNVTPAMIEAGAAQVEWRKDTATAEELARFVYSAMVSAKSERASVETHR